MDFDGDGRTDYLTGSMGGKVYLFHRKPNGAFMAGEEVRTQVRGGPSSGRSAIYVNPPSAVAMADWFDSGKLDLFVGTGNGYVYLYRNEGTRQKPAFRRGERLDVLADGGNASPFVADWDGDGQLDLLVGCGSGRVIWHRNAGTAGKPKLAAEATLIEAALPDAGRSQEEFDHPRRSGRNAKICVADWNGDGLTDLIVGDYSARGDRFSRRVHGWVWVYLRKPAAGAPGTN